MGKEWPKMNYWPCQLIIRCSSVKDKMSLQKTDSDNYLPFSQRFSIDPNRTGFQLRSMDDTLRNRLWNCIYCEYMMEFTEFWGNIAYESNNDFVNWFWAECLKRPSQKIHGVNCRSLCDFMCNDFLKKAWYEIYDIIEKVAQIGNNSGSCNESFIVSINEVLRQEMAGYQLVGNKITPLVNEYELSEVGKAIDCPVESARKHIEKSLALMSDRIAPDYANSVKESICAVEAIVQAIGKTKKTLGDGIKELGPKIGLPSALRESISKLYGYASATPGIRHGQEQIEDVTFDEAKMFLIICSAWVNYLVSKAQTSGAAHFLMNETG